MDGENHGKSYEQMDLLGGFPIIFGSTPIYYIPPKKRWNLVNLPGDLK